MTINIIHTIRFENPTERGLLEEIIERLNVLQSQNKKVIMKQEEALQIVKDLKVTLGKVKGETSSLLDKITALEQAAANQDNLSAELSDAITDLKGTAQSIDDLVPDVTNLPGEGTGTGEGTGGEGTGTGDQGTGTDTGTGTDEGSGTGAEVDPNL